MIKREQLAKPEEPPAQISEADIYIKTRKREETREYKLPTDVVTKNLHCLCIIIYCINFSFYRKMLRKFLMREMWRLLISLFMVAKNTVDLI